MLLFVGLSILVWVVGGRRGLTQQARWLVIALVYVGFVAAVILLPERAGLRTTLGGTAGEWLAVGMVVAVGIAYARLLRGLKARVRGEVAGPPPAAPETDPQGPLSEAEIDRYARHIVLHEVGGPGQRALKQAKVLVVGAGGLGSPALLYLAAGGVGTLGVIDDDVVDVSNLQRQVIHTDQRAGMPKVFSAQQAVAALNPFVTLRPYNRRLTEGVAADLVADYDIVLDGSDNFDTRYLVNRVCAAAGTPLVSAAMGQWEGQISVFDPARGAPCYACVFPDRPLPEQAPPCAEAGVIGPLPGVMGSMMALEAMKLIAGAGAPLRGAMLIYDALHGETRRITIPRQAGCPVCGTTEAT